MTADIPNAFVETDIDQKLIEEMINLKIQGKSTDMLLELSPETYAKNVIFKGNNKILDVIMEKALCGMLPSSSLFYKNSGKDNESINRM